MCNIFAACSSYLGDQLDTSMRREQKPSCVYQITYEHECRVIF